MSYRIKIFVEGFISLGGAFIVHLKRISKVVFLMIMVVGILNYKEFGE